MTEDWRQYRVHDTLESVAAAQEAERRQKIAHEREGREQRKREEQQRMDELGAGFRDWARQNSIPADVHSLRVTGWAIGTKKWSSTTNQGGTGERHEEGLTSIVITSRQGHVIAATHPVGRGYRRPASQYTDLQTVAALMTQYKLRHKQN